MKKRIIFSFAVVSALLMTACFSQEGEQTQREIQSVQSADTAVTLENTGDGKETRILTAYFTRLDNTNAALDEVIRGGGPYGPIGDSLDDADPDAVSSASITIMDGQACGNVEALARMIQKTAGGDLFSIKTAETYPVDYDMLIDQGGEEKASDDRPELTDHVKGMEDYDILFLGFPNWWGDMPMAVYSFLEEYDFSGKKIIPFAASAGSGFSDTAASIRRLLPGADIESQGLHISMRDVADAQPTVEEWIKELGLAFGT